MTEVLSWGTNKYGQLGEHTMTDRLDPVPLEIFRGAKIVQVSAGAHHSLAVAEMGDVYVWGRASEGQWGNGERRPTVAHDMMVSAAGSSHASSSGSGVSSPSGSRLGSGSPYRIWSLRSERVKKVATGNFHSLVLTEEGRLYEFGRLYRHDTEAASEDRFGGAINLPGEWARGLLERSQRAYYSAGVEINDEEIAESDQITNFGAFKPFICSIPRHVPGLETIAIRSMSAGYSFNVAVAVDGRCFSWGYNERFQLGLGDRFSRTHPTKITFPPTEDGQEPRIIDVTCGEQHTLFLSRNGSVYSCGMGVFGQLGHGTKRDERTPKAIAIFANHNPIVQISCGSHHSAAVDSAGTAWVWGHAEYSQMGGSATHQDWGGGERGSGSAFTAPRMVSFFQDTLTPARQVKEISCGDLFTLALTHDHEIYGWGWNSSGALGTGNRKFSQMPSPISRLHGEKVTTISAGGVHSLAITDSESSTFATDFKEYVGNAKFADIRFIVQNVEVPAHRILLYLRSPIFAAQIAFMERYSIRATNGGLVLPGVKVHVFRAFLGYLYTDHLQCTVHWLEELREMALRFRLPYLEYLCRRQLCKNEEIADFEKNTVRPPSTFIEDMKFGIDTLMYSDIVLSVPKDAVDAAPTDIQFVTTGGAEDSEDQSHMPYYAHRVILAARCPYLKRMFDGSFSDRNSPKITFQGISESTMQTLLRYIYAGDESSAKDPDMLVDLLMLSDRFMLSQLKQVCEEQLEQGVNDENVGCLLILADRYNAPRLRKGCLNYLKVRWHTLMNSAAMQDIKNNAPDLEEIVRHFVKNAPYPLCAKKYFDDSSSSSSSMAASSV